jgi:hypothetical protein
MSIDAARLPCYLAEWYRSELTAGELDDTAAKLQAGVAAMRGEGSPVQLLMTLAIPADEVLFGIFTAGSAQDVSEVCRRAGIPAERLSSAENRSPSGEVE